MTEPTLGEMFILLRETRGDVKDIHEAMFTGHEGHPPVLSRLATLEERTAAAERRIGRAPLWTGIGSAVGAAVVVVLGYFGVKPGQQ